MRNKFLFLGIFATLLLIAFVSADVNSSQVENASLNLTLSNITEISNLTFNQTPLEYPLVLKSISPSKFNLGEAQFSIRIENIGNSTLENIIPLISAPGFLTSNIIPIDILSPNSTGYLLVSGRFISNGTIPLEIRINSQKLYYNLTINPDFVPQISDEIVMNVTSELNQLKKEYSIAEKLISNRSDEGYDVSSISLLDAKKYLREAESALLTSDMVKAKANLKLASDELADQNTRIENAKKLSWFTKFKSNALAFSAVAGALVTIFAAYELLKKKGTAVHSVVVSKVQEVKSKINK